VTRRNIDEKDRSILKKKFVRFYDRLKRHTSDKKEMRQQVVTFMEASAFMNRRRTDDDGVLTSEPEFVWRAPILEIFARDGAVQSHPPHFRSMPHVFIYQCTHDAHTISCPRSTNSSCSIC
jgi:hypothetical protein